MGFFDFQWADDVFVNPYTQLWTGGNADTSEIFGSKQTKGPEMTMNRPDHPQFNDVRQGLLDGDLRMGQQGPVGFNSNIGSLYSQLGNINLDTRALDAYRQEGLRSPGQESPWASLMKQRQGIEQQDALDQNARGTAGAAATARSAIAARGGITSGGSERIARDAMRMGQNGSQSVYRQGMLDRLDIGTKDETNRLETLKNLPGMELASLAPEFDKVNMWSKMADTEQQRGIELGLNNRDYASGVDKYNIGNALAERDKERDFKLGKYKEDMAGWAAERQARATEQADAGKK